MRESKFRAWDQKHRQMLESYTLQEIYRDGMSEGWEPGGSLIGSKIDHIKWLEFSGRKDKNGEEIYEGDLCSDGTLTYIVKWVGSGLVLWISDHMWRFIDLDGEVLVVGNIYENPELLGTA